MKKILFFFIMFFLLCVNSYSQSSTDGQKYIMTFNDAITDGAVMIFDDVKNEKYIEEKKYSLMKFYISPICQFIPLSKDGTVYERLELKDKVRYTLRILYYHDKLYNQAADILNYTLSSVVKDYKIEKPMLQIFNMSHSMVKFKIKDFEEIKIEVIGKENEFLSLPKVDWLRFYVDKKTDENFRKILDATTGVTFEISILLKNGKCIIIPSSTGKIKESFLKYYEELFETTKSIMDFIKKDK